MKRKTNNLLIFSGLVTAALHMTNRIQYSNFTLKNILKDSGNEYYEWRFGKVCYHKKGSGTPILLLHDLTVGSSSYEFSKIMDVLAENHEVYAIDFLGYGLSEKPNITYTNYLYVQQVNDFIKKVIGKKTDVLATGDAVPVAVMLCHSNPELIHKLLFINPQNLYDLNQIPSRQTKIMKTVMELPILGTFIYNLYTSPSAVREDFETKYFYDKDRIKEEYIDAYVEAAHKNDYHSKFSYTSYLGKYMNTNIIQALKEISQNIYIIAGREKENNKTIAENYTYYNPSIKTKYVERTKQLPHLEQPTDFLEILDSFLKE